MQSQMPDRTSHRTLPTTLSTPGDLPGTVTSVGPVVMMCVGGAGGAGGALAPSGWTPSTSVMSLPSSVREARSPLVGGLRGAHPAERVGFEPTEDLRPHFLSRE